MHIPSPCKRECTPTWDGQKCEGCGRYEKEIDEWVSMPYEEQLTIIKRIEDAQGRTT